jgi:transcriptional regulator with XRE-family HTH domain
MKVRNKLKKAIKKAGGQVYIGEKMGISQAMISAWINGQRKMSGQQALKMSNILYESGFDIDPSLMSSDFKDLYDQFFEYMERL